MKVRIYLDVPSYATKSEDCNAHTYISDKLSGNTRYAIDVEIPDPAKPDVEMMAEATEVKQ